jgi:hypothetical protein
MLSVLGMAVSPSHQRWVCGSTSRDEKKMMCLFQFELPSGKLVDVFPDTAAAAGMFNDVAVAAGGNVFATDPATRSLYKADRQNKIAVLFMRSDSLKNANGIAADGNALFVSTSNGFAKAGADNKSISLVSLANYQVAGNDGLYYYKGSLVGIQNVAFPVTIGRYFLNSSKTAVEKATILSSEHKSFDVPTTGALAKDEFYFMANTNLLYYDFENGKTMDAGKMKKIKIMKLPLSR